jgi:hypothetical protein
MLLEWGRHSEILVFVSEFMAEDGTRGFKPSGMQTSVKGCETNL